MSTYPITILNDEGGITDIFVMAPIEEGYFDRWLGGVQRTWLGCEGEEGE
jgi:hypothetical protein